MTPDRLANLREHAKTEPPGHRQVLGELLDEIESLQQTQALPCEVCGWNFKFPDEPCAHCERVSLRSEVSRLSQLLEAPPVLKSMSYTQEDGLEVNVEHWGVKMIAASVLDTLLNGRDPSVANFVTMTINSDIGPLEVTVRKMIGCQKTPADRIHELESQLKTSRL